ncbi:hypothetical protein N7471_007089 [Penicillium samsonianum]|uniref:uncharacterized protein n=1 Tax=Penicillium samsonianum TaxID=1882272 RepID=UPI00254995C8|nr:uncharacterized protein N7471_007089 [Penicillium samsonianum]KAJ6131874.1 hypothetical protein N7471_007089 [Penicillium samsonianum]
MVLDGTPSAQYESQRCSTLSTQPEVPGTKGPREPQGPAIEQEREITSTPFALDAKDIVPTILSEFIGTNRQRLLKQLANQDRGLSQLSCKRHFRLLFSDLSRIRALIRLDTTPRRASIRHSLMNDESGICKANLALIFLLVVLCLRWSDVVLKCGITKHSLKAKLGKAIITANLDGMLWDKSERSCPYSLIQVKPFLLRINAMRSENKILKNPTACGKRTFGTGRARKCDIILARTCPAELEAIGIVEFDDASDEYEDPGG